MCRYVSLAVTHADMDEYKEAVECAQRELEYRCGNATEESKTWLNIAGQYWKQFFPQWGQNYTWNLIYVFFDNFFIFNFNLFSLAVLTISFCVWIAVLWHADYFIQYCGYRQMGVIYIQHFAARVFRLESKIMFDNKTLFWNTDYKDKDQQPYMELEYAYHKALECARAASNHKLERTALRNLAAVQGNLGKFCY